MLFSFYNRISLTFWKLLFVSRIWVRDFPHDYNDLIAEGIMAHLMDDKKIFWKDIYDQDVAARTVEKISKGEHVEEEAKEHAESVPPPLSPSDFLLEFKEQMQTAFKYVIENMEVLGDKVVRIDSRLTIVKEEFKSNKRIAREIRRLWMMIHGDVIGGEVMTMSIWMIMVVK